VSAVHDDDVLLLMPGKMAKSIILAFALTCLVEA
jgi:hypothetical protein